MISDLQTTPFKMVKKFTNEQNSNKKFQGLLPKDEYGKQPFHDEYLEKRNKQIGHPVDGEFLKFSKKIQNHHDKFYNSFLSESKSHDYDSERLAYLRSEDSSNLPTDEMNTKQFTISPETQMNTIHSHEDSSIENHFAISNMSGTSSKDIKRFVSPSKKILKCSFNTVFDEYAQNNVVNTEPNQVNCSMTKSMKNKMQYYKDPFKRSKQYLDESDSKISFVSNPNDSFSNVNCKLNSKNMNRTSLKGACQDELEKKENIKYSSCEKFYNRNENINKSNFLDYKAPYSYTNLKSYDRIFRESLKGKQHSHNSKYQELKDKVISQESSQKKIIKSYSNLKNKPIDKTTSVSKKVPLSQTKFINFEYSLDDRSENQMFKSNSAHKDKPKYHMTINPKQKDPSLQTIIHKFNDSYEKVPLDEIKFISHTKIPKKSLKQTDNNSIEREIHVHNKVFKQEMPGKKESSVSRKVVHHSIDPSRIKFGKIYKKGEESIQGNVFQNQVMSKNVRLCNDSSRDKYRGHYYGRSNQAGYLTQKENPYF